MDTETAKAFLSQFTCTPLCEVSDLLDDRERVKRFARLWWKQIMELKSNLSAEGLNRAYEISDALIFLAFEHGGRAQKEIDVLEISDHNI